MPADVLWLDQANNDLEELFDYLASESPRSALDYVNGLRNACRNLPSFPLSGRAYSQAYRVIVYRNHLVFYRYDASGDRVTVTMIVDGRRDVSELLASLPD